jgi:hypothetical protein
MGSKFKTPPKTLTDKSVPDWIAKYEKLSLDNFSSRLTALKVLITGAINEKKGTKLPDVIAWLNDVIKIAETDLKHLGAAEKALDAGLADGTSGKLSQAPRYAAVPEVLKAYNQGFAQGLKMKKPPVMKARP